VTFWNDTAYQLARKITKGSPLAEDLVSHVYILLHKYNVPDDELPRTFVRFAHNQWNWWQSDFNKTHRGSANTVELSDLIPNDIENWQPTDKALFLQEYMDESPVDDSDQFCKELTRMHLYGMTYREINKETGISLDIIHKAIKQVKNDIHNSYQHRYSESDADLSPAGY
jgi:DNA-directed RNA polymerase specialized sigma24 family protein